MRLARRVVEAAVLCLLRHLVHVVRDIRGLLEQRREDLRGTPADPLPRMCPRRWRDSTDGRKTLSPLGDQLLAVADLRVDAVAAEIARENPPGARALESDVRPVVELEVGLPARQQGRSRRSARHAHPLPDRVVAGRPHGPLRRSLDQDVGRRHEARPERRVPHGDGVCGLLGILQELPRGHGVKPPDAVDAQHDEPPRIHRVLHAPAHVLHADPREEALR